MAAYKQPQPICDYTRVSKLNWVCSASSVIDPGVYPGPAEVGVQGVPGHTQYLTLHLVKTKFFPKKFGSWLLCAHPIFNSSFSYYQTLAIKIWLHVLMGTPNV